MEKVGLSVFAMGVGKEKNDSFMGGGGGGGGGVYLAQHKQDLQE